jgi:hypothetical protein
VGLLPMKKSKEGGEEINYKRRGGEI